MKFPIASPPSAGGVYLLSNRKAKIHYVGNTVNLRRRWSEWRGCFANQTNIRSRIFIDAINRTEPEDWFFIVLERCDDAAQRRVLENRGIAALKQLKDVTVLNDLLSDQGLQPRGSALSTIVDAQGRELTQQQAAQQLGCLQKTLSKRLKQWRRKGKYEWTIEELKQ